MNGPCPGHRYPPVDELLPHRGRMLLLDSVLSCDDSAVVCQVVVREDFPFLEDGRVPGLLAVEFMAQAVAAYAGLQERRHQRPVRIGYLLGSREVLLDGSSFPVGEELIVEARHQFGDDRIGSFACMVRCSGRTVAAACINVYQGTLEDLPT